MSAPARSLCSGFLASCERDPGRPALDVAGRTLSYAELRERAAEVAATLARADGDPEARLSAVFGHRSMSAFSGILGVLMRGHGYVPLNPAFPAARTRSMLERAGCAAVVVEAASLPRFEEVLQGLAPGLLVIVPELEDAAALAARWPMHRFVGRPDLAPPGAWRERPVDPDEIAYLLFTSGSTGQPKGVMVAHRNVTHFIRAMVERYGITPDDRFSQTFDLTFDLSVFDLFVAWERGACVCVPSAQQKMLPGRYVKAQRLSVWFSVPSTGALMSRLRMLAPDSYPDLRLSLFCGEALPVEVVEAWQAAAPNSLIENLYGPTELTIACTLYRWDPERSAAECEQGCVPIGSPYPGMEVRVLDADLREVAPGETGELALTGPQLTPGYWQDPERSARAYVTPAGETRTFYRTGDRVRRPHEGEPLRYLGRIDHQIKIQGYRVELGEIEAAVREEAGTELAVAIGWPRSASGAEGVVAFVAAEGVDTTDVRARLKERLPGYMAPREVRVVEDFPLNANGKVDRAALEAMLADATAAAPSARPAEGRNPAAAKRN